MTGHRLSRRALLRGSMASLTGVLLRPQLAAAQEREPGKPVLVCVFLRGAADGLSVVVPHGDPEYYRLRPSIAVPPPHEKRGALDLDGRFGLHPRLAPLRAAYDAKQLAVIHAVGSPHPTRSHFEAQDYMQSGAVGDRRVVSGWLARYLASRPSDGAVRALALTSRSPLALRGYPGALVTESLRELRLGLGGELGPLLERGFTRMYAEAPGLAERSSRRALEASSLIGRVLSERRRGARYPRDAQAFSDVARLVKADVGLEAAWLDLGGWDTHRNQGSTERGDLPRQLDRLARGLAALRADLDSHFERVVVLVMSEFGRTARENGTGGTDHGHGGVMLVLGGSLVGGRVLGDFPGLGEEHLFEGRDVPVTTDFRDVLAEVCEEHWGVTDASSLFPGYAPGLRRRLGLFAPRGS